MKITQSGFLLICYHWPFLVYVNDLSPSSIILSITVITDNTNLLRGHKNIIKPFATVNEELRNMHELCMANKPSLNERRTKYSLLYKPRNVDNLSLKLLKIINHQ